MEIHCYRLNDTGFRIFIIGKNETIFRWLVEANSSYEALRKAIDKLNEQKLLPE